MGVRRRLWLGHNNNIGHALSSLDETMTCFEISGSNGHLRYLIIFNGGWVMVGCVGVAKRGGWAGRKPGITDGQICMCSL